MSKRVSKTLVLFDNAIRQQKCILYAILKKECHIAIRITMGELYEETKERTTSIERFFPHTYVPFSKEYILRQDIPLGGTEI